MAIAGFQLSLRADFEVASAGECAFAIGEGVVGAFGQILVALVALVVLNQRLVVQLVRYCPAIPEVQ